VVLTPKQQVRQEALAIARAQLVEANDRLQMELRERERAELGHVPSGKRDDHK